eukprot:3939288-Rhodomonas_salina.1
MLSGLLFSTCKGRNTYLQVEVSTPAIVSLYLTYTREVCPRSCKAVPKSGRAQAKLDVVSKRVLLESISKVEDVATRRTPSGLVSGRVSPRRLASGPPAHAARRVP